MFRLALVSTRFANKYTLKNVYRSFQSNCSNNFESISRNWTNFISVPSCAIFNHTPLKLCLSQLGKNWITAVHCKSKLKRADLVLQSTDIQYSEKLKFDWIRFVKLILPELGILCLSVLSALCAAYLNVKLPLYLGNLVNVLSEVRQITRDYILSVQAPVLKLLAVYFLQGVFTAIYISLLSSMGENVAARMRNDLFNKIIKQDVAFFDTRRSGEILNRLTIDIQEFKSSFKLCISQGVRSSAQILGSVGSLYFISPTLTTLMIITVPAIVGAGALMGRMLREMSRQAQTQTAKTVSIAEEAIGNIKTVKSFAMEEQEISLFNNQSCMACEKNKILGIGIGIFQGLSNFALNSLVLTVLFAGGKLMKESTLTGGDLMAFLVATQSIQKSLAQMSTLFGQALKGYVCGCRVFEYMRLEPVQIFQYGKILPSSDINSTNIKFDHVQFAYPARPNQDVFDDFNLEIPSGKIIAMVGKSGSGKTTVTYLLERFYDPISGRILLGGHDLRDYDLDWLRRRFFGVISQEPQLFHTTIKENIRYGRPDASDLDVEEAARLANADLFIKEFPLGYDTIVGERGSALSGGQKQRIAIARALLKDPAVLILDEATSALDSESEGLVQQALDRVMKNRTVIIIAHRLSTVKCADQIVVMSHGKILEKGTHDDLMSKKGHYAELVRRQHNFEKEM